MEGNAERLALHARAAKRQEVGWLSRLLLASALVLAASPADAVPKDGKARAAFDDGIAAYQKADYAGAAAAFGKSYGIEADVETLFAWAQAERQQEN